uniref:Integrase catalytic domain-containing protein n=1 Tax=Fagus sylvatica TaxID=28930 RepID=A0A2N9G201_FAGSY
MEGAPNDGTSADPAMTPIERQMQVIATSIQDLARETSRQNQELWQAIRKGPPTPHDDNQPPPRGGNRSNDQEADSHQVTRRRGGEVERTPPRSRHRAESAGSSAPPSQHKTAKTTRSSKQPERPDRSSKQPEREDRRGNSSRQPDHPDRSARDPDDKTARLEKELREMRKQMGDMKNSLRAKAARNLDNLVHRADSPFIPSIADFPLPSRFKVPLLENFDGTKDPFDYLEAFKTIMQLQAVPEEVMCRAFPLGLRGSARVWFNKLESESIGSFVQLSRAFIDHFIGSQRRGRPPTHLLSVKQMEGESLRAFVHRFNEEAMKIDRSKRRCHGNNLHGRSAERRFPLRTLQGPPETMSELMYEAYKTHERRGCPRGYGRPATKKAYKTTLHFGGQVKIRSDPNNRPKNLYCRFHRDHGHLTEECVALKEQIETLIRQGKLQKYVSRPTNTRPAKPPAQREQAEHNRPGPVGEIRTIVGGPASGGTSRASRKAYARTSFTTRRVMVDNGSSADILYLPAYQQMRLDKDKLRPMDAPLVGFTGDKVCPVGIVTLPITVGTHPKTVSKTVDFLVVNCPSAYNAIIGRPTLNRLRAVTSTYHLLLKFPTEHGIGEVRGDQIAARECYLASLGSGGQNQDDEHRGAEDSSEAFWGSWTTIELEDGRPERTTKIGADLPPEMKESLRPKRRVFAPERNNAIMEEVDKLLAANFIREVFYPDWLANVVMVKKSTGKWRMLQPNSDGRERSRRRRPSSPAEDSSATKVMPFGLKNAGATYQRLMNRMFHDQIGRNVEVYVDDMLVKSKGGRRSPGRPQRDFPNAPQVPDEAEPKRRSSTCIWLLSPTAVSSALIREEERRQLPVYYTSRALRGAEERYPPMEKLAFRPSDSCKETPPILPSSHDCVAHQPPITESNEQTGCSWTDLSSGRLSSAKFDIDYRPRTAIKAQALADFIAEFTSKDDEPTEDVEQASKWTVNIDGSSTKDSGGVGIVLRSPEGDIIKQAIRLQYPTTNNEAEYEALLVGTQNGQDTGSHRARRTLPDDRHEARRLKVRASRFLMLQGTLYKRGFSLPYLRCLAPDEANYVMREIHEGVCGDHSGARALQRKIVRAGYYWPSMKADTYQFVQRCDKCQRFANLLHSPPMELVPMTAPWPFRTKLNHWQPSQKETSRTSYGRTVICRFGIPRVLVSDNGKQFDNPRFRQFSQELGIHNHYSSPGHPQANGQVEVTNRSLLKLIKTRLEGAKGLWPEELPSILWAYRTTVRIPTGETPFRMTFGSEAVVPVEIGLTTFRTSAYDGQEK